VDSLSKLTF